MNNPLPVIISIPHGGMDIPPELNKRVCLSRRDILFDVDAFTRNIYDLEKLVIAQISTKVARTFVDLNREPDDLPPKNQDGVIKEYTIYRKKIYLDGLAPDKKLIQDLLEKYYYPYHLKLQQYSSEIFLSKNTVKLALDCHSMANIGPEFSPDKGQKRPLFCLGNVHNSSCGSEIVFRLADCLRKIFDLKETDISLNNPFKGGHITRKYGNKPIPWIQVEMNRVLYLKSPWFDAETLIIDPERLKYLNQKFQEVIYTLLH